MLVALDANQLCQSLGRVTHILYISSCGGTAAEKLPFAMGLSGESKRKAWPVSGAWPRTRLIDGGGGLPYKPRKLRACAPGRAQTGLFRARWRRQRRETDLSAEQIGAQTSSRLSCTDGDKRRPQGCGRAACAGTQATQCVTGADPVNLIESCFAKSCFARSCFARSCFGMSCFGTERLKRRTDFRAAASGMRAPGRAFVLQARRRADEGSVRVGFTVSRQVGNAVVRNRVRRRLRELVKRADPGRLRAGHDYVLVGRSAALAASFGDMARELDVALDRIHARERKGTGGAATGPIHEAGSPSPVRAASQLRTPTPEH